MHYDNHFIPLLESYPQAHGTLAFLFVSYLRSTGNVKTNKHMHDTFGDNVIIRKSPNLPFTHTIGYTHAQPAVLLILVLFLE